MTRLSSVPVLFAALMLSSCGGSTSPPPGANQAPPAQPASSTPAANEPAREAPKAAPRYRVLDLKTGNLADAERVPSIGINLDARTSQIVFMRVEGGNFMRGEHSASPLASSSPATYCEVDPFYMAVFETTMAQWQALGGGSPWKELSPQSLFGKRPPADALPAYGISLDAVTKVLATDKGLKLALPTDDQWEYACLAGSVGMFSWGDEMDYTRVSAQARVRETIGSDPGVSESGGRAPNTFGMFDMHGNVWEWTASGHIRGGSSSDNVFQSRAANRVALAPSVSHGLVGVRFVLKP